MQKQDWINKILDSHRGMQRAETPPFLYEKILGKIEAQKFSEQHPLRAGLKWALALSIVIIITLNILSVQKVFSENKVLKERSAMPVREFNHFVIYNY